MPGTSRPIARCGHVCHTPPHEAGPDGAILVSLDQDAHGVNSNVYLVFFFPPIDDSSDRPYVFCLSAPDTDLAKAITAIGPLRDTYPKGRAVFTPGMWGSGRIEDLAFHLSYDLVLWQQAVILLNRLAAGKPAFLGARWLYALLILVYLCLLHLLFLYRSPDREADPDR